MADDNKNPTGAGAFMSFTMGADGPTVQEGDQDAVSSDDLENAGTTGDGAGDQAPSAEDGDGGDDASTDAPDGDEEGDGWVAPEEFDPESVEEWDGHYQDESGSFREDVLTTEWDANEGKGLNEATYDYLASKGFKKDFVKEVEAAMATKRDAAKQPQNDADMRLMELAGGPEPLKEALDWGKAGGYSKEAQERFNKVMNGKDLAAKEEAVELLMARFGKAPKTVPEVPKRDVTKGKANPGRGTVKPFKDVKEYREALKAAGDDQVKVKQITARRVASKF